MSNPLSLHRRREMRLANRLETRLSVQYRRFTQRLPGIVLDLSCDGARLSSVERLRPGDKLWLTLPGLAPCLARVVWVNDSLAGCRLAAPLHPAVLKALVESSIA
jgi:hypothetical protein